MSIEVLDTLTGQVLEGCPLSATGLTSFGIKLPNIFDSTVGSEVQSEDFAGFINALITNGLLSVVDAEDAVREKLPADFHSDPHDHQDAINIVRTAFVHHYEQEGLDAPETPVLRTGAADIIMTQALQDEFNQHFDDALYHSKQNRVASAMDSFSKAFEIGGNAEDYASVVDAYYKDHKTSGEHKRELIVSYLNLAGYSFQEGKIEEAMAAMKGFAVLCQSEGCVALQHLLNAALLRLRVAVDSGSTVADIRDLYEFVTKMQGSARLFYRDNLRPSLERRAHRTAAKDSSRNYQDAGNYETYLMEAMLKKKALLDLHFTDEFVFLRRVAREVLQETDPLTRDILEAAIAKYSNELRSEELCEARKLLATLPEAGPVPRHFTSSGCPFFALVKEIRSMNTKVNPRRQVDAFWETAKVKYLLGLPCEDGCLHDYSLACPIYAADTLTQHGMKSVDVEVRQTHLKNAVLVCEAKMQHLFEKMTPSAVQGVRDAVAARVKSGPVVQSDAVVV